MAYRKSLSRRQSAKKFRKGNRINKLNLNSGAMAMRGGVRL